MTPPAPDVSPRASNRPLAVRVGRHVVQVGMFVGQERGVGREDAVPRGQIDQLLDQLVVLALQVDFVEDLAHAADGPELLDEAVAFVAALLDQLGGEIELLLAGRRPCR